MSLLDVIEDLATDTLTVTRLAAGSRTLGRWTPGGASTFTITAVLEPAGGRALKVLAEGQRADDIRVLYTATELLATAGAADRLAIAGEAFEVFRVEPWTLEGETHYRVWLSRRALP